MKFRVTKTIILPLSLLFFVSCKTYKPTYYGFNDKEDENNPRPGLHSVDIRRYSSFYHASKQIVPEVQEFYESVNYQLVWISDYKLTEHANDLMKELAQSHQEGLAPYNYNVTEIRALKQNIKTLYTKQIDIIPLYARLDLLLTNAYFDYASDLLSGRMNPNQLEVIWEAHPRSKNLIQYLQQALATNSISRSLEQLKPNHKQYTFIQNALLEFQSLNDARDWPLPGYFPLVKLYDTSQHVIEVKKFLKATGDLDMPNPAYLSSPVFDDLLDLAVKKFQVRHGLEPDGLVGSATQKEMNVSLKHRINQLKINLERIRWLPEEFGDEYVIVNLPDYVLRYYKQGDLQMEMKIVIGELENYTPILKDTLQSIVFNPPWNVPMSIAREEMLPKIKSDSNFLKHNNYVLLRDSYISNDTVLHDSVDWSEINEENFPFYIVQKPSETNALGEVKFLFPNHHSIYLHDTPADHLFGNLKRDFSHGCIRLEKPFELAKALLDQQLSTDSITRILTEEETKSVYVEDDVMVHFIYQTAWVDRSGQINFRNDIYDIDKRSIPMLTGQIIRKKSNLMSESATDY